MILIVSYRVYRNNTSAISSSSDISNSVFGENDLASHEPMIFNDDTQSEPPNQFERLQSDLDRFETMSLGTPSKKRAPYGGETFEIECRNILSVYFYFGGGMCAYILQFDVKNILEVLV